MKKTGFISSPSQLESQLRSLGMDPAEVLPPAALQSQSFPLLVPVGYASRICWTDPNDPLRRMTIPDDRETIVQNYETEDPLQDGRHSPVPGLIHRYPNRCLLLVTRRCAVHCRFCFRKSLPVAPATDLGKWMEYLRLHTEITEVIFSGGDPLTCSDEEIAGYLDSIRHLPHVKRVRFHTRMPVVFPERVDDTLIRALTSAQPVRVVLHVNHSREWSEEARKSAGRFLAADIPLLSQTVLLRGVNDHADTLSDLFRRLNRSGVIPYYLHHLDPAAGTWHFRVSLKEGRKIWRNLKRRMPGARIPEYVMDLGDGAGKVPVETFQETGEGVYRVSLPDGNAMQYRDPAILSDPG